MASLPLPLDKNERWTSTFIKTDNPHSYVKAQLHYFCEAQMHTHDFYEFNFVMHGNGKYYHSDNCISANVGDVYITPPDVYHGYLKKTDFYIYNLCILKDFFDHFQKEISGMVSVSELLEGAPYLHNIKRNSFSLHVSSQNLAFLKADLDLIVEIDRLNTPSKEYTKNAIALKILAQLGHLYSQQYAKWKNNRENTTFASVMETVYYMKNNFPEKITLESLAEVAHMSRSSYIRNFKTLFNVSPMEYLRNLRIERARLMIISGKHTKSFIAQECGFYDVAHMGKYI
ncbi:MAG: helix-turn-helix domain-containing protein [Clostridia bacterium]|nr:helix-turn-helix domain-containing protein [Clostridia bacterium]